MITPRKQTGFLLSGLLLLFLFTGCTSSRLLTSQDYEKSLVSYYKGDPTQALKNFPKLEKGYFITTMEKGYLGLLSGKPENKSLQKLADIIESRVRYQ